MQKLINSLSYLINYEYSSNLNKTLWLLGWVWERGRDGYAHIHPRPNIQMKKLSITHPINAWIPHQNEDAFE